MKHYVGGGAALAAQPRHDVELVGDPGPHVLVGIECRLPTDQPIFAWARL